MSIILEALRKAEASRGEQDRVGLIGTPLAREPLRMRVPLWIPAAGIAAVLGAGVAFYALRPSRPAPEAAVERHAQTPALPARAPAAPFVVAAAPASAAVAESAAEDDAPQPQANVRPLSREVASPPVTATEAKPQRGSIEVQDLSGADASAATASTQRPEKIKPGSVEVRDLLVEQGAPPVPPEAPAPLPDSSTGSDRAAPAKATPPPTAAAVPSVDDLVAGGQLEPPNLSLDMHTYSNNPASCFVYINMRLYHNGDTTREGAIVEEITADGVIMRMHGLRFLLQSR